jgi:hypothetical protein
MPRRSVLSATDLANLLTLTEDDDGYPAVHMNDTGSPHPSAQGWPIVLASRFSFATWGIRA